MVAKTVAAVSGAPSGVRVGRVVAFHVAGLVLGASTLMFAAVAIGTLIGTVPVADVAAAAAAAAAGLAWGTAQLIGKPVAVPMCRRQVPLAWSYFFAPCTYMFLYGAGLGLGVATRVATASLYVSLLAVLFMADPLVAIVAATTYAAARALPVAVVGGKQRRASQLYGRWAVPLPSLVCVDGLLLLAAGPIFLVQVVVSW